ncbi:hypothetical protein HYS97_03075 [Candidatus Daviesbacteria bacterium]|nr:hypothetical protein [Candidatus Daviesbacteria bacterium]
MGKTKIKTIDDSAPKAEETEKKPERKKLLGANIARDKALKGEKSEPVKADGAVLEKAARGDAEERSRESTASASRRRGRTRETAAAGPRAQAESKPKHSKKYQEFREKVERNKYYPINEAAELAKEVSYSKFDGTLEIHINTAVKSVRGLVSLPFASGKKLKILAFPSAPFDQTQDRSLRTSGLIKELEEQEVIIGDEAALEEISKGKINFDVIVTTPEWMPKLAKAAKVLGPRGLMPNPKNGTISTDLKKTVAELQGGKVEYKTEARANIIHLGIGKVTQPQEELTQNIKVLLSTIGKTKIKKAVISPTMGPGIKLDLSSL